MTITLEFKEMQLEGVCGRDKRVPPKDALGPGRGCYTTTEPDFHGGEGGVVVPGEEKPPAS